MVPASDLSTDLLFAVFSRLPAESIMCCRCVCKKWNLLTQDPLFIKEHMNMNGQGNRQQLLVYENPESDAVNFLLLNVDDGEIRHTIPVKDNLKDFEAMSSFNGLLCLSHKDDKDPIVVYNPITRESVTLPPFQQELRLCFIRDHTLALCFDTISARYKVIRTFLDRDRKRHFYMITAGREDTWKRLSPPRGFWSFLSSTPTCWKGDIFWTMIPRGSGRVGDLCCIMAFNPHLRLFQVIVYPQIYCSCNVSSLLHMGDYLAMVEYDGSKFRLWKVSGEMIGEYFLVLEKEYDTCIEVGKYDAITRPGLGRDSCYKVVGVLNEGGFLLQLTDDIKMRSVRFFKFIPGTMPPCEEIKILGMHTEFTTIINYKSSLISPTSILASRRKPY